MKKLWLFFLLSLIIITVSAQNNRVDSVLKYLDENGLYQYHQSKELVDELHEIACNSPDSLRLLTYHISEIVRLYSSHSLIDVLHEEMILNHSLRLDSVKHRKERAILDYTLGSYYDGIGDYGGAFINSLRALEQFKQLNDSACISRALNLLGVISNEVNQHHLGNNYFTEQLKYIKKNSQDYFSAKQNQYLFFAQEGELDKFIDSMKYLIIEAEKVLPDYQIIPFYLNLSNAYYLIDSLDLTYDYLIKSQEAMRQIDNNNLQVSLYANFADYFTEIDDHQQALDYYQLAHRQSMKNDKPYFLRTIYCGLAFCYETLNEKDSAIFYLKKFQDVIFQEEQQNKAISVYQQYIANYLELTENQLIIAQQDAELQKERTIIIVISLSFALFALLVIIFVIVQQRRRKKAEWEAKEKLNQAEKAEWNAKEKLAEMEKKRQEDVIAAKSREIVSYSLMASSNHELLQKIAKLNGQIADSGHDDVKANTKEIEKLIKENQNVEQEWDNFKQHFEKVHPDFFKNLKTMAPNLSKENLRLCAYIKIGFSTKEIAQILHVTTGSVLQHRHRIREKFDISKEEGLESFIRSI